MNLKQKADDLRWAFDVVRSVADPDPGARWSFVRIPDLVPDSKTSFPPTLFCSCGSAIRDRKETSFSIWDQHPGSETLGVVETFLAFYSSTVSYIHYGFTSTRTVFTVCSSSGSRFSVRIASRRAKSVRVRIHNTDRTEIFNKNPILLLLQ
jgi:hypothetical protein